MVFDFFRLNVTRATAARAYKTSELHPKKKKKTQPIAKPLPKLCKKQETNSANRNNTPNVYSLTFTTLKNSKYHKKKHSTKNQNSSFLRQLQERNTHCKTLTLILHETEHQHCNRNLLPQLHHTPKLQNPKETVHKKIRTPRFLQQLHQRKTIPKQFCKKQSTNTATETTHQYVYSLAFINLKTPQKITTPHFYDNYHQRKTIAQPVTLILQETEYNHCHRNNTTKTSPP